MRLAVFGWRKGETLGRVAREVFVVGGFVHLFLFFCCAWAVVGVKYVCVGVGRCYPCDGGRKWRGGLNVLEGFAMGWCLYRLRW